MSRLDGPFPRVPRRHKGYAHRQVNALLRAIDATLAGASPALTAGDVRRAGFELVHGGYDVQAVDAALDDLEEQVLARAVRVDGRRGTNASEELAQVRGQLLAPSGGRFPRLRSPRRGHNVAEVDALTDLVFAFLDASPDMTLAQLRSATFRPQRGGYDQHVVDATLDRLIELILTGRRVVDVTERPGPVSPGRTVSLRISPVSGLAEGSPRAAQ